MLLVWLRARLQKPARAPAQTVAPPATLPAAARPAPPPARRPPGLRFRVQICCHTGHAVSVQAFAPEHLAQDADALLRLGLGQLRAWDAAGLHVPQLAIELPVELSRHEVMALPLIWEIDRQEMDVQRLIFSAPPESGRGRDQAGLMLLARHGCAVEICSFDPADLKVLRQSCPQRARLRIPQSALRDCHRDPGSGQVVLSLLALAERHEFSTLGDGVSKREEHGFLAQLGCSVVQGDAVAPLLDANATTHFLRALAEPQFGPIPLRRPAA